MFIVTGANGFIGRHVVALLAERGFPVFGYGRSDAADPVAGAAFRRVDDYAQIPAARDAVLIHLAEPSRLADLPEGADVFDRCCALQQSLLADHFAHVVYASSAVVYGAGHDRPCRVGDTTGGKSDYARLKMAGESVARNSGGTILRIANTVGRGMSSSNVLSHIIAQLDGDGPIRLQSLAPVRDFIHVHDVARAVLTAAVDRPGGTYNVGTGKGTSVRAIVETALRIARQPDRAVVETGPSPQPASSLVLDIGDTTDALGWRPVHDLADTLNALIMQTDDNANDCSLYRKPG